MKTIAIKLNPSAEKMVKKGHPWVFETGIKAQKAKEGEGKVGDLAIVFDNKTNKFLACGFYDPQSPIKVKLLQFHQSVKIDEAWFSQKIATAFKLRQPLLQTQTNAYRLIFGENDGFPALIADVYDKVLVLKLYSAIWFAHLHLLADTLAATSACTCVLLRLGRNIEEEAQHLGYKNGQVLLGELASENVVFKEHGIFFKANLIKGHKTGFFLDHRHNRLRVGKLASGKKTVLDVFSYAGGFSVHALAGGAREVTSIDISEKALNFAQQNSALNKHKGKHITLAKDAFMALSEMVEQHKRFDIVVIDPPSFAKQQSEIGGALYSYERLANLGIKLVNKGGILLLASCSSRISAEQFFQLMENTIAKTGKKFTLLEKTYHDIDHPIAFAEGAYLKAVYYKIEG